MGRDLRADIRIADPRISRAHLILRFDQGKWVAIDNGSVNGTFVNGYRRPVVDIHDGQSINVGNAGGPRLTFEIGPRRGKGGEPPARAPDTQSTRSWSTGRPARALLRRSGDRGHRRSIRPMCRTHRRRPDRRPTRPRSSTPGRRRR